MNYSINTIGKLHKNLKRFLNLAIKYNLISPNDYAYRNFKVETESTKREALSMNEVIALEKLTYDRNSINEQVKDMFLFACYTGLRISDVIHLKNSYCKMTDKGWRLEFKTFKVQKMAYLPLKNLFKDEYELSKPERIIDRYYNVNTEFVFPSIPESKINRQLKARKKQYQNFKLN